MTDAQHAKFQENIAAINTALDTLIQDRDELVSALKGLLDCNLTQFGYTPPALQKAAQVLARIEGRAA